MALTVNERKQAERDRKRLAGRTKVEVWLPVKTARNVRATLEYMRAEIKHGADVTLSPDDARELLEYFGAS